MVDKKVLEFKKDEFNNNPDIKSVLKYSDLSKLLGSNLVILFRKIMTMPVGSGNGPLAYSDVIDVLISRFLEEKGLGVGQYKKEEYTLVSKMVDNVMTVEYFFNFLFNVLKITTMSIKQGNTDGLYEVCFSTLKSKHSFTFNTNTKTSKRTV